MVCKIYLLFISHKAVKSVSDITKLRTALRECVINHQCQKAFQDEGKTNWKITHTQTNKTKTHTQKTTTTKKQQQKTTTKTHTHKQKKQQQKTKQNKTKSLGALQK